MLYYELHKDEGILLLKPKGPLAASDFENVANEVDPYILGHGKLNGVLIDAETFPGWSNFSALLAHLRFVKDHHRKVEKVAAVSDSQVLSILPHVAKHFVKAEVRHFDYADRDAALAWLRGEELGSGD